MRESEGGLGLNGKNTQQEFSLGHIKFEIPARHKIGDKRIGSWNIGVWEHAEEVWVECKFGRQLSACRLYLKPRE